MDASRFGLQMVNGWHINNLIRASRIVENGVRARLAFTISITVNVHNSTFLKSLATRLFTRLGGYSQGDIEISMIFEFDSDRWAGNGSMFAPRKGETLSLARDHRLLRVAFAQRLCRRWIKRHIVIEIVIIGLKLICLHSWCRGQLRCRLVSAWHGGTR